jgi:uncharacterized repeat protein (TIGR01451 family)
MAELEDVAPIGRALLVLALLVGCGAPAAQAGIAILSPPDGETRVADPCPFPVCTAAFPSQVQVTGDPVDYLDFEVTPDVGLGSTFPICSPPDPIEGKPGCPLPPVVINTGLLLREGTWTVVVRARRGALEERSTPIRVTVLPSGLTPAGTISLSSVAPLSGAPAILARDPGPAHPDGIRTAPGETTIVGRNLDNNPFLEVHVSPIRPGEPPLTADSGLPVGNWCTYPARILGKGPLPGGLSFLKVELPALPLEAPTSCTVPPGASGSIFAKQWRWLIHDRWIRPERQHDWWAIPTPQALPWRDAPPFRMAKPPYPLIDGFGFKNKATEPRYKEFLTVFGNNAYICVGAFGFCATHVPDPLYHLVWWPIYDLVIGGTGGSCNGISATSLLMSREELQTEPFSPDVRYPVGFDQADDPARYSDPDWCTPVCSPPRPDNLWAHIRMNHGVQFSREFLFEVLDTLGEAIFDPNDVGSIRGVPQATLERVAADPRGYVLCFFAPGNGHCVTPFAVEGNQMLVYDNNNPGDAFRYIEVAGGDYSYPARADEPNGGNAIMAFPIDIWKEGRHLLGLQELVKLVKGDVVEFLFMIATGAGDMTVTTEAGGRWGFEEDGSFTDSLLGALSVPPLGPQAAPSRAMPLLLAMNQPAPTVQLNARGGRYLWSAGAGGHILQLEASDATDGDKDRLHVDHPGGHLAGFDFTPQRAASRLVPRVGLVIGDQERALFHFLGLSVPGGKRVGFGADKQARAVAFENDTGVPTHHVLALDHVAGPAESHGRMIYGPFEVPDGARQRVRLARWPDVAEVVSELDLDRDGTPDVTEVVPGRPSSTPLAGDPAADLSVSKQVSPARVALGGSATFTVNVTNVGPETATGVELVDAFPAHASVSDVATTLGQCQVEASAVRCDIGTLAPGDSASVTYRVKPRLPGTLANGATLFGAEGDPDLTNNSAFATLEVPVRVDVRPGQHTNVVRVGSRQLIPVAILGQRGFSVRRIDASTLAFGPAGAEAERTSRRGRGKDRDEPCGELVDVNHDGRVDLLAWFRTDRTGIALGDAQACVRGTFLDGRSFTGCDAILTRKDPMCDDEGP